MLWSCGSEKVFCDPEAFLGWPGGGAGGKGVGEQYLIKPKTKNQQLEVIKTQQIIKATLAVAIKMPDHSVCGCPLCYTYIYIYIYII
jgi:hypothetical protein